MTGTVLPRGEAGEIAVKGPTLMLGYLRMAAEETLRRRRLLPHRRRRLRRCEGRLHWQGRLNDIIKTGGANVSPLEIDAVLRECPGVKIAATVGIPHDTLGEMVVACVVREDGATARREAVALSLRSSSRATRCRVACCSSKSRISSLTSSNKVKTAPLRELAARRLADEGAR